jgi:putative intracellular protease/amidase
MSKVLIVLTNAAKYEKVDAPTGLWLSELTHFYDVLVENKVAVDFVSPDGGYVPVDPQSLLSMDEVDRKWYTNEDFRNAALGNTLNPMEVLAADYDAIYYAGGHGTMFDFPKSYEVATLASAIYKKGGIVSAICHGVVGLMPVVDEKGAALVKGRTITGFTNEEEKIGKATEIVPFLAEDALKDLGANYQKGAAYTDVVRVDGRLITGQNPQSAHSLGIAVVKKLAE